MTEYSEENLSPEEKRARQIIEEEKNRFKGNLSLHLTQEEADAHTIKGVKGSVEPIDNEEYQKAEEELKDSSLEKDINVLFSQENSDK